MSPFKLARERADSMSTEEAEAEASVWERNASSRRQLLEVEKLTGA